MNEHAVPADLHKLVDSAILAARRDATYKTADTMQAAVQARMALLSALSTQEAVPPSPLGAPPAGSGSPLQPPAAASAAIPSAKCECMPMFAAEVCADCPEKKA